ncbi:MAG: helix-turn-helix domain-containing protein [Firmicutes bacterium]|nr:helix-turn-helix domain-containing protein [Bacillota bacterium]
MDNILGKRLKELRVENNLTQEEFGKNFNLRKSTISQYESGKSRPDDDLKKSFAKFFNVTIDYLLGNSDIRNPYEEDKSVIPTKAYHNLDKAGLPEEAIRQIEEYIEFVKQKYTSDGTLRKNK